MKQVNSPFTTEGESLVNVTKSRAEARRLSCIIHSLNVVRIGTFKGNSDELVTNQIHGNHQNQRLGL